MFFVIFVRFLFIREIAKKGKWREKTVIKIYALYTDLRITARKLARLSSAAEFYFWNSSPRQKFQRCRRERHIVLFRRKRNECLYPLYIIYKTDYAYYE